MSGFISPRAAQVYVSLLILLSASIIAYGNFHRGREMKGEYIQVEKDAYEKNEKVRIELKNDGSASWSPLSQYLKIYRKDIEELVYDGHRDVAMPAVPDKQTFFWNQTNMEGNQVESGTYRAVFMEKYEAKFVIES